MLSWFFKKGDNSKQLDTKFKLLDENIRGSFTHIKEDMKKIGDWIDFFNSKEKDQKEKFQRLEWKIEALEDQLSKKKEYHIVEKVVESEVNRSNSRSNFEHVQPFNRSVQPFMNVQPGVQPEYFLKKNQEIDILTPAQKRVLGLLLYSGGPMDYQEIARRLEINEITARRHMNDLRRAGIEVKRKLSDNGRKNLFFIDKNLKEQIVKGKSKGEK
ncbi:MAG TPA: HTH domain-containing protein [Candidatus Nanoarchaeia archaeon]|nr:HTH domain-containing protein [Candidatus Nanoarchaeia archaeon]